jgi:hypothetical protein
LVAGGDDTTRPRHRQGNIIRLFFTTLGVKWQKLESFGR